MLEALRIKGFRKYKDFSIEGFGSINFILGDNNIGKTSILEAVYAWACGQNVVPFINIPLARGRYSSIQQPYWMMEELLATMNDRKTIPLQMVFDGVYNSKRVCFEHSIYPSELLSEYDTTYKNAANLISIRSNSAVSGDAQQILPGVPGFLQMQQTTIARWEINNSKETVSTEITLPLSQVSGVKPYCLAKFIDVLSHTAVVENVQIYASLKRENLLDEVTEEINKVFPEIMGFDMIPYPDGTQSPISVIKKDGILPLYACGDGVQRWFYMLGALSLYKNSIICIDEIDTGFHSRAQIEFSMNLVRNALKNRGQIFATTHNLEFLDHFLEALQHIAPENQELIKVITLRETSEGIKTRVMAAREALNSRRDYNLELR